MTLADATLTRAFFSAIKRSRIGAHQFERISTTRRTRSVASAVVATRKRSLSSRNATLQIERLCQEFCRARSSLDKGRTPCKRHRMDTLHAPGARTPFGHGAGARVWQGRRRGRERERRLFCCVHSHSHTKFEFAELCLLRCFPIVIRSCVHDLRSREPLQKTTLHSVKFCRE